MDHTKMMTTPMITLGTAMAGKFAVTMDPKVLPLMPIQVTDDSTMSAEKMAEPRLPNTMRERNAVEYPVAKAARPIMMATAIRKASAQRKAAVASAKGMR